MSTHDTFAWRNKKNVSVKKENINLDTSLIFSYGKLGLTFRAYHPIPQYETFYLLIAICCRAGKKAKIKQHLREMALPCHFAKEYNFKMDLSERFCHFVKGDNFWRQVHVPPVFKASSK